MDAQLIQRTQKFLFSSREEMSEGGVPVLQQARILRLRELYLYWIEHPLLSDRDIAAELRNRHGIGATQSYDDVRLIKVCLGNINQATKDYYRWKFLQHCEEAFEIARKNEDAGAYARVLSAMVKGTGIDKEEVQRADYSQIVPERLDFTDNPEVVGFERIANLDVKVAHMLKKYAVEVDFVEETTQK